MPPRRGGTIGILDRLYDGNYIDEEEFHHCIGELMEHNGGKVWLPVAELKKRMQETGNAVVKNLGYNRYTRERDSVTVHHDFLEAPNTHNMDYDDAIEYLTTVVGINNGWCSKDSLIEIGHTLETPICDMSSEWVISNIRILEKEVADLEVKWKSDKERKEIYEKLKLYNRQIAALYAEMVLRCEEGEEPDFAKYGLDLKELVKPDEN